MRIVSLLPGTTEILHAIGMGKHLVGRSHECDYPPGVQELPHCTEPKFKADGTSYEIDRRVEALLQEGLSVYRVNAEKLAQLSPDLIVTQDHCEVCAASVEDVKKAVREKIAGDTEVLSVSPGDIHEVLDSIRTIGTAAGAEEQAERLARSMRQKLADMEEKTRNLEMPDVLCIEWLDPLMSAGNWMPELVQIAGGYPLGGTAGEHSPQLDWPAVQKMDPEIIIVIPCGYPIDQTVSEIDDLTGRKGWNDLRAVRNKQVFIADGNHYFNRPGPRLVESAEILGEIIHPSLFRISGKKHPGWINLHTHLSNA